MRRNDNILPLAGTVQRRILVILSITLLFGLQFARGDDDFCDSFCAIHPSWPAQTPTLNYLDNLNPSEDPNQPIAEVLGADATPVNREVGLFLKGSRVKVGETEAAREDLEVDCLEYSEWSSDLSSWPTWNLRYRSDLIFSVNLTSFDYDGTTPPNHFWWISVEKQRAYLVYQIYGSVAFPQVTTHIHVVPTNESSPEVLHRFTSSTTGEVMYSCSGSQKTVTVYDTESIIQIDGPYCCYSATSEIDDCSVYWKYDASTAWPVFEKSNPNLYLDPRTHTIVSLSSNPNGFNWLFILDYEGSTITQNKFAVYRIPSHEIPGNGASAVIYFAVALIILIVFLLGTGITAFILSRRRRAASRIPLDDNEFMLEDRS